MQTHNYKYLVILFFSLAITGLAAQPTITSFAPASGNVGTTVTITGTNFSSTPANNIVYFGSTRANVSSSTTTSITTTVPFGSTYQPITVTVNGLTGYSAKPFIVTFAGGSNAFTTSSFASKIDSTVDVDPISIASGDFDGDGKADIVTSNRNGSISVLKNISTIGTIAFNSKINYPTAGGGECVFVSDLDGDGKLDIIAVNALSSNSSISIFRNVSTLGNISFSAKIDFATASHAIGISTADLDGDGKPDLAVICQGVVSIFKNTSTIGNITLAPKLDFGSFITGANVATGDLDGDGKPDLAVIDVLGDKLYILRNTSNSSAISFAAALPFPINTGSQTASVAIGDLDGDGKPDLAISCQIDLNVYVFKNNSTSGVISLAPKVSFASGGSGYWLSIGDLNGDGMPDIATANATNLTGGVSVLKNTSTIGTIGFASYVKYATGGNPSCVSLVDLDGNGIPDLSVSNQASASASFLRNLIGTSLPISILNFKGQVFSGQTQLQWQTTNEVNASNFVIEYSTDGVSFLSIGNVVVSGNINSVKNYSFTHNNPRIGVNYYRLKMIDLDGKFSYSKVVEVRLNTKQTSLSIHPNPAKDFVIIEHPNIDNTAQIKIIDLLGKTIQIISIEKGSSQTSINLKGISTGTYQIIWSDGLNNQTQKFIVQ